MGFKKWMLAPALTLLAACSGDPAPNDEPGDVMEVTVGPHKVNCAGVGPRQCLVVDGKMFYQPIDGFDFSEGFEYRLKIRRVQVHEPETAPADASLYRYELIELLSQTPASP